MPASESLPWAIWGVVADAVLVFLYVMSVSIAYVFGTTLHPILMAIIAFLIPYFSFWLLPTILILASAINGYNLYT